MGDAASHPSGRHPLIPAGFRPYLASRVDVPKALAAGAIMGRAGFHIWMLPQEHKAKPRRVLSDAERVELEKRAAICEGCENNRGVTRMRGKFDVWGVKCAACGTCGLRPLARGCVLTPPKFGP